MEKTTTAYAPAVSIVIPTLNAASYMEPLLRAITTQHYDNLREIIVLDSQSTDRTCELAALYENVRVETVEQFSHGGSRNMGTVMSTGDIVVFLSQDALPANKHWLENLIKPFQDADVAAAFSRQVPRPDANPMERYFLLTHFPEKNRRYGPAPDGRELYFQDDVFFSNVSSALRRHLALDFPFSDDIIMSEDQQFARDVQREGFAVAYAAESVVCHSHKYTLRTVFQRYFDSVYSLTQVFPSHGFTHSIRLGARYAFAECLYILRVRPFWFPYYLLYALNRAAAVFLAHWADRIPLWLVKKMSMHKYYWDHEQRM